MQRKKAEGAWREPTEIESKLADIALSLLVVASEKYAEGKTTQEVAQWAINEMSACGLELDEDASGWPLLTKVQDQ